MSKQWDEKDQNVWDEYQNSFASIYTPRYIQSLNCSKEMKEAIIRDIKQNSPNDFNSNDSTIGDMDNWSW